MALSSPLLDQYNQTGQITPPLSDAVEQMRKKLVATPQAPAPASPAPMAASPAESLQPDSLGVTQTGSPAVTAPATPALSAPPAAPSGGLIQPKAATAPTPTLAPPSDHQQELTRLTTGETGKSGIGQIHHAAARIPLQILEGLGNAFLPALTASIPGTTLHHQMLVNQAERNVQGDAAAAKGAADTARIGAETGKLQAETPEIAPNAVAERGVKLATTGKLNAETPEVARNAQAHRDLEAAQTGEAGARTASLANDKYTMQHTTAPDGSVYAMVFDPKTGELTNKLVYKGDPKVDTEVRKIETNGQSHEILVDKKDGSTIKDLGVSGEKPVDQNAGTWQIQEDKDGKPVQFNTKTGEVRPVQGGLQKSGTAAKAAAATEKEVGPARDALEYAQSYIKNGVPTGPGDEALQEKFFELAKPSVGFRMTQPQMDMLQHSQSWMHSMEAHVLHATKGTWFSDEQRKQIVGAMADLGAAKMKHLQGGQAAGGGAKGGEVQDGGEYTRDASGKLVLKK
jgi:hypothetical protein